ncbi:MAG: hypothetical protein ACFFCQ_16355, partial [Promethearchaeota archaeon]
NSIILGFCIITVILFIIMFITIDENSDMDFILNPIVLSFEILVIIIALSYFTFPILQKAVDEEVNRKLYPNGNLKHTFCPQCGSSDISFRLPQLYSIYRCKNCGYQGSIIVEDGILARKIRSDYSNKIKEEI